MASAGLFLTVGEFHQGLKSRFLQELSRVSRFRPLLSLWHFLGCSVDNRQSCCHSRWRFRTPPLRERPNWPRFLEAINDILPRVVLVRTPLGDGWSFGVLVFLMLFLCLRPVFEMQPFVRESVGAPGRVTHCALDNYEKHAEHVHLKCPDSSGGAWKETGEVFVST